MERFKILAARHLALGCVPILLAIDVAAGALVAIDLCRLYLFGLCPSAAFRDAGEAIVSADGNYAYAFIASAVVGAVFLLLAPLAVAVGRVLPFNGPAVFRRLTRGNAPSILFAHAAFCALLAFAPVLVEAAKRLSGYRTGSSTDFAFGSVFEAFVLWPFVAAFRHIPVPVTVLSAATAPIVGWLGFRQKRDALDTYEKWCVLADVGEELQPAGRHHKVNFNAPVLAPEIPSIRKRADAIVREYDRLMPGTPGATEFLARKVDACRKMLRDVVGDADECFDIELFPTTARAVETAIARLPRRAKIVVSPFEHPNMGKVAAWYAGVVHCELRLLSLKLDLFRSTWEQQEEGFLQQFRASTGKGDTVVLIISEVNYYTGMIVPVDRLVRAVRKEWDGKLILIVDGSHSVGNAGGPRFLSLADAYVFAVHKWLLSPEPGGVLLSRKAAAQDAPAIAPPDAWGRNAPSSTLSVRTIASLSASLSLIREQRPEDLWRRSTLLQEHFLKRARARFEVVGEVFDSRDCGLERTHISALRPRMGRWRWKPGLDKALASSDIKLASIPNPSGMPWVVVAFPFFLDVWHLHRLQTLLESAVEEYGTGDMLTLHGHIGGIHLADCVEDAKQQREAPVFGRLT